MYHDMTQYMTKWSRLIPDNFTKLYIINFYN